MKDAGDGEVLATFAVRRFTQPEFERGETAGWRLCARWHRRASGLRWAWFRREVGDDGETHAVP